jgi:hypothetical protein
VMR